MTSPGLRPGARPVAAACVCAVRTLLSSRARTRATSTARSIPRTRAWPFATLTNPYAFATAASTHVFAGLGRLTPEDFEDAVQDALLWAWERRHCAHILATDFPGYISAVIRVKLRKRSWRRA